MQTVILTSQILLATVKKALRSPPEIDYHQHAKLLVNLKLYSENAQVSPQCAVNWAVQTCQDAVGPGMNSSYPSLQT